MTKRPSPDFASISIFSDLTGDEAQVVRGMMRELTLEKGSVLFKEGDEGREMFVVLEGRICVCVSTNGTEELCLAEMEAGSFFGEMSLIESLPRSATCKLIEKSSFLSLDHEGLVALMTSHGAIAGKILYRMLTTTTSRLRNTSALLSDMVQWGESARMRVISDQATGLYNRRFFDDSIVDETKKAKSSHAPLSMIMVDLDHFGSVNRDYGEAFGDTVILAASQAFKRSFRKNDLLCRYGGDEFAFLLPATGGAETLALCSAACAEVERLRFAEFPDFRMTASMGIAVIPDTADSAESLLANADKALYQAKESGRNRAVLMQREIRPKRNFTTIAERGRTIDRIVELIGEKSSFLVVGHELPDEDCISSLVAAALLIVKFDKSATIYIRDQIPAQLAYMRQICDYNKIAIKTGPTYAGAKPDAVFVLDTPKPDMIAGNQDITPFLADASIPVVEIDHHLSADAALSGTEGYCLVAKATSTCELLTLVCIKLNNDKKALARYGIENLFSRNIVLALLTGIIGDTRFGLTVKTNRDQFFYRCLTAYLSKILRKTHRKNSSNYSSMTDISNSIQSMSVAERDIYQMLLDHSRYSGRTGYVALDDEESLNILGRIDYTVFVKVIKSVTDFLSEQSGTIGLTAYYDMPEVSNLIQFRIRVSRDASGIDLRSILLDFNIADGGGHPGAIGFRMPKNAVQNYHEYVERLLGKIESLDKAPD
jgi:diguanylate cyclase (GGDEF)-like protein